MKRLAAVGAAGAAAKAATGIEARTAKAVFENRKRIGELVMITPLLVSLSGSTTVPMRCGNGATGRDYPPN